MQPQFCSNPCSFLFRQKNIPPMIRINGPCTILLFQTNKPSSPFFVINLHLVNSNCNKVLHSFLSLLLLLFVVVVLLVSSSLSEKLSSVVGGCDEIMMMNGLLLPSFPSFLPSLLLWRYYFLVLLFIMVVKILSYYLPTEIFNMDILPMLW